MSQNAKIIPVKKKLILLPPKPKPKPKLKILEPEPGRDTEELKTLLAKPIEVAAGKKKVRKDQEPKIPAFVGAALDPPIKWPGGKSYQAKHIIGLMPKHIHFVEPFAGGLAVLLAKEHKGFSEVVNDSYGPLANFWKVLGNPVDYAEFVRLVQWTPFSEQLWQEQLALLDVGSPAERAKAFFIRVRLSREGKMKTFATLTKTRTRRKMNEQASALLTAIDGLPAVHERLKGVVVLNSDALDVIRREDKPNTLFYLDPTYLHETRVTTKDYQHEMTYEQHRELLELLTTIKGKFMLSGYRSKLYDDYAAAHGWRRVEKEIDCKASNADEKPMRTECLWMNY